MKITGIIPARYASTRLPGKLLKPLGNKTVLWHTYNNSRKSKLLNNVIVAAGDKIIYKYCKSENIKVELTPIELKNGTERCMFLASKFNSSIIVNIQGDEPFIRGSYIDSIINPFINDKKVQITTAISKLTDKSEISDPSVVKSVLDNDDFALYFSRAPIPFKRDKGITKYYKHIGIYGFRKKILLALKDTCKKSSYISTAEKLEQLDWLYYGFKIKTVEIKYKGIEINTPADLRHARAILG